MSDDLVQLTVVGNELEAEMVQADADQRFEDQPQRPPGCRLAVLPVERAVVRADAELRVAGG